MKPPKGPAQMSKQTPTKTIVPQPSPDLPSAIERLSYNQRGELCVQLTEACELLLEAWKQLMPNLKHGVVQDYELVLTTAPVKAREALARARGGA